MICEFIDKLRSEGHATRVDLPRPAQSRFVRRSPHETYREWTSPQRVVAARTVSGPEVGEIICELVWQPDNRGRRKMQPAGLYGRRKMLAEVHRAGLPPASSRAVDRTMRTLGLSRVLRSKKVYTAVTDPDVVRAPGLVDRDFTSNRPNRLRVDDSTYVRACAGFTYVSFIVDVLAQRIVA